MYELISYCENKRPNSNLIQLPCLLEPTAIAIVILLWYIDKKINE